MNATTGVPFGLFAKEYRMNLKGIKDFPQKSSNRKFGSDFANYESGLHIWQISRRKNSLNNQADT